MWFVQQQQKHFEWGNCKMSSSFSFPEHRVCFMLSQWYQSISMWLCFKMQKHAGVVCWLLCYFSLPLEIHSMSSCIPIRSNCTNKTFVLQLCNGINLPLSLALFFSVDYKIIYFRVGMGNWRPARGNPFVEPGINPPHSVGVSTYCWELEW